MTQLREQMIRAMELKNLSANTQRAYLAAVTGLAKHYRQSPINITDKMIEDYLLYLKNDKGIAPNSCSSVLTGLRFFYQNVAQKQISVDYSLRKKPRKLPTVLTMEQVAKLICAPKNLKHRLMLITTCSAGLRASEVMALKTEHIDSERMLIKVKDARVKKIDIDCFLKNCWASCACITKITDPKLTRFPHRLKKGKINPYLTKRCAAFIKKPAKRPE
jgi:site-specific recombinase XerD